MSEQPGTGAEVTYVAPEQRIQRFPPHGEGHVLLRPGSRGVVLAGPNSKGNFRIHFERLSLVIWLRPDEMQQATTHALKEAPNGTADH
jgi:hypothetical protein